ncbi:sporulation membrane protein YtaF [Moorellaceae bacterium AZ2]
MSWGIALLLAFAVSLDGLGIGFSYGLRRIKLPWVSLILIALISTAVSFASLAVGKLSTFVFKPVLAQRLGALLLLILGLEMILEAYLHAKGERLKENHVLIKVRVPRLGVAIAILQEPHRADRDCSGSISPGEALTLGLALALDALGTGVGAGATGFSFWLTPLLIGLGQFLMVGAGLVIGRRRSGGEWEKRGPVLPGVILIAIGLWRM